MNSLVRGLKISLLGGCLASLSACTTLPELGDLPDEVPPQSVAKGEVDSEGRVILTWDRPSAFGKISGERKALGDAACLLARIDLEAFGYHPRAKDVDGNEMPGGGYFCVRKASGDKPGPVPPMLVVRDGIVRWDLPAAFGAVPPGEKARGDAVCAVFLPSHEAFGYHPDARDEAGRAIDGGGFFCGPRVPGVGPS
jgi:hypothetical protein